MKTAFDILRAHGISTYRMPGRGRYYTTCPHCSASRKKKREPCLSVEITEIGVRWRCHHCPWKGGELYEPNAGKDRSRVFREQGNKRGNRRSVWGVYG